MGKSPTPAPAVKAPQTLGRVAESQVIRKAPREYADAQVDGTTVPRVTLEDGRLGAIQAEVRVDGTSGPLLVSLIRVNADGTEGATRFSLADISRIVRAYADAGLPLV